MDLPNDILHLIGYPRVLKLTLYHTCRQFRELFSQEKFSDAAELVAETGSITLMEWVLELGYKVTDNVHSVASINGHLPLLKWLHPSDYRQIVISASRGGHIDILEWIHSLDDQAIDDDGDKVWKIVVHNGYVHVAEWLISKRVHYYSNTCITAVVADQLDILKLLLRSHIGSCSWPDLGISAAREGRKRILEWLFDMDLVNREELCSASIISRDRNLLEWLHLEKACPLGDGCCEAAISIGDIDLLAWLRERDYPWGEGCYRSAIKIGSYKIIEWLEEQGCPWDPDCCYEAIESANLDMLKWLHLEKRQPLDDDSCVLAIHDVAMLEWLRSNGCSLSEDCYFYAIRHNDLEIMEWLYRNDCPWNEKCCTVAALNQGPDMLAWLREKGCPIDWTRCINACNSKKVLRWCIQNGLPLTTEMYCRAIKNNDLETFKLLHSRGCERLKGVSTEYEERGCPRNGKLCALMASRGHLDMLRYAVENGFYWKKEDCLIVAMKNGHTDIIGWITSL